MGLKSGATGMQQQEQSPSTAVLSDARREYALMLAQQVQRHVMETLDRMYASNPDLPRAQRLMNFQKQLRAVQHWNQGVVEEHTNKICHEFKFFTALLSATFVSSCKVLLHLHNGNMGSFDNGVQVLIPSNPRFVHEMFINIAQQLYENPQSFKNGTSDSKMHVIVVGIERAVRKLMPVEEVLRIYLGDAITAEGDLTPALRPPPRQMQTQAFSQPEFDYTPPQPAQREEPEPEREQEIVDIDVGTPPPPPPVETTHEIPEGHYEKPDSELEAGEIEALRNEEPPEASKLAREAVERVDEAEGLAEELPLKFFDD